MITEVRERIESYMVKYTDKFPCSEIRDLYKRLFQGFHGAAHSVTDRESARDWLMREWEQVSDWKADKICDVTEAITIEGVTPPLFIVHLGPARMSGADPNAILDEFLRTSESFPKESLLDNGNLHELFIDIWKEIGTLISKCNLKPEYRDYPEFTELMERNAWLAVHHSEVYRNTYNPHYRVILDPSRIS
jgi:hypothetical protein